MKNLLVKNLVGLFAVLTLGVGVAAQAPKRIDLAKDGPSIIFEQSVAAKGSQDFVLYLKKGQRVKIGFTEDSGQGSMDLGKVSIEEGFDNAIVWDVEVSKDYNLYASNPGTKRTSFRISVSLEDTKKTAGNSGNAANYYRIDTSNMENVERVQFGPGSIERNYTRNVAENNAMRFLFSAKKGQEIIVVVTPQRKGVKLMTVLTGQVEQPVKQGEPFTTRAPYTGDYLVQVLNNDNVDRTFDINLGVADAEMPADTSDASDASDVPDTPDGERIKFGKGKTSAMVTKEIPAQGSVDFVLGVKKGQTLGYTVGYDFKDSDIKAFLTEPGMQDISKTSGPKAPQEFVVKKSGDHRITVNNMTRKKITITLYVDVE